MNTTCNERMNTTQKVPAQIASSLRMQDAKSSMIRFV